MRSRITSPSCSTACSNPGRNVGLGPREQGLAKAALTRVPNEPRGEDEAKTKEKNGSVTSTHNESRSGQSRRADASALIKRDRKLHARRECKPSRRG